MNYETVIQYAQKEETTLDKTPYFINEKTCFIYKLISNQIECIIWILISMTKDLKSDRWTCPNDRNLQLRSK